jgi:DNA-binding LacI/PurR family transcriptional regulator
MGSRNVANQLTQWIQSGRVDLGSYLPPMRELASQFGVSLHTVGMAIKQLETQKLVECLPRQGAVVRARTVEEAFKPQIKQIAIIAPAPPDAPGLPHARIFWTTQIIHAMEQALFETGYATGLVSVPNEENAEAMVAARLDLFSSSLAGVLCFPNPFTPVMIPSVSELDRRQLPWIAVNRPGPDFNHNYVSADHQKAGRKVGGLFAECGFERVLLMAHNVELRLSDFEKITGFFQGYLGKGVSTQGLATVSCRGWEEADGYRVMRELLGRKQPPPQAIFTTGDLLAMGAIRALTEQGFRVPEDVSIVGTTGLPTSGNFHPPLAVVAQPMVEIGRSAALLLNEMISEGLSRAAPRRIPCKLILRESLKIPDSIKSKLEAEWKRDEKATDGAPEVVFN